jgi:hypothetical protein
MQWYPKTPSLANAYEKVSPGLRVESKSPVSEVTVWAMAPLFVQHTVVPGGTLSDCGL